MRDQESNIPDLATPINSQGGYGNAMGDFTLDKSLSRKVKSRKDLAQPAGTSYDEQGPNSNGTGSENGSIDRYFGSFSIESKRHVWDLLKKHPEFGDEPVVRKNRIRNNTREVLLNDPFKNVINGGFTVYEHPEENNSDDNQL
jgi:hypothetical protein